MHNPAPVSSAQPQQGTTGSGWLLRHLERPPEDAAYRVASEEPVSGELMCFGAKNLATKAMVAAVLGETPTVLTNIPDIGDVTITEGLLRQTGMQISRSEDGTVELDPAHITSGDVSASPYGTNRLPILLLGALLNRFDTVSVPIMGGCRIGDRTVNFHLEAIRRFGPEVEETVSGYVAHRSGPLRGAHVVLEYPSVGATETSLMLAVGAQGASQIDNVAIEPEILELVRLLQQMGADVQVDTTRRTIQVYGKHGLPGTSFRVFGDRVEAASWACLAAATGGSLLIGGVEPYLLGPFLTVFQAIGEAQI